MIDRSFYVYLHYQPYQSYPFYIGKGKGRRAFSRSGRSPEWKMQAELGLEVIKYAEAMPEVCAFTLEKILIAHGLRDCLVNKTGGGAGSTGSKHGDAAKEAIRATKIGAKNPMYGRRHTEEAKEFRRKLAAGRNHPQFDWVIYQFYHQDHGKVHCLRSELIERYNLSHSKVCNIISGKRKTHQGWSRLHD